MTSRNGEASRDGAEDCCVEEIGRGGNVDGRGEQRGEGDSRRKSSGGWSRARAGDREDRGGGCWSSGGAGCGRAGKPCGCPGRGNCRGGNREERRGIGEDQPETAKNQVEGGEIEPERSMLEATAAVIGRERGRDERPEGSVETDSRGSGGLRMGSRRRRPGRSRRRGFSTRIEKRKGR